MVRGDDNNSIAGCDRWRLRAQALVWIILRIEMPLRDAEQQLVNSPEMHFKIEQALIEQALIELEKKVCEAAALGMRGIARIPYDPAARYPGLQAPYPGLQRMRMARRRYVDLSDAQSAAPHEFLELIRRPDVEYNLTWLGHVVPASAPTADAAAPVANTEAPVAKLEPAARAEESMPRPASPVEPELAPPTEPPQPVANTEASVAELEAASSSPVDAMTAAQAAPKPAPTPELSQSPQAQRQPGGRPTDRDMVLGEADWRLRNRKTKAKSLPVFAQELHKWLEVHGEHRNKKTGEVMKVGTIKRHVRPLWNKFRQKP